MCERTTSELSTQGQIAAEQVQAAPSADATVNNEAAQIGEQTRAATEAAEAAEAAAREEAHATLKAAVRAFAKGERAYRTGLLESGRLCDLYVHQRLALGDGRAAAVQALEGQLAADSSGTVDVNRLISCHHAWRLLAEAQGLDKAAESVPYGHYRDAYARLLVREGKDTPQENWILLPGMESECQAIFAAACQAALSKAAVEEKCQGLLRRYADAQAAEARARQQAAEAEAQAKREAELRARQQAEQAEAKAKAARTAGKGASQPQPPQTDKTAEARQGSNLLAAAKAGTAKDVAEMASELITGCQEPDSTLEALLRSLDGHKELSKQSHRAIKAALIVLANKPQTVPARNGQTATAAVA